MAKQPIAILSEFDYFHKIPMQVMIEDEYEHDVSPVAALTGDSISFDIPGEPNVYRDLSNSYLEVQCKITKQNGTNLDDNTAVAPVNLLLHSMFSHLEIKLCGQVITDKESLYHYRSFIESLLTYNGETLQMRESLAGWALDKTPSKLDTLLLAAASNVDPNPAFVERATWCANSKIMTLTGRPHADLFHQDLDIPAGCDIHMKFTRNPTALCIMAAENATHKLAITAATMHVRSKRLDTEAVRAHRTMLTPERPFSMPHTKVEMKTFEIGAGVTTYSLSNLFSGCVTCPKRIIVGLIENARRSGRNNLNPFLFKNHNLNGISVKVGAQTVPRTPLTMKFDDPRGSSRAYLNTLFALGKDIGNSANTLTPELWQNTYNLYAFKLVPGPINGGPLISPMQSTNVSLDLSFSTATTEVLTVIIYAESLGLYEIDILNRLTQV